MDDFRPILGARVKALRTRLGLTQEELAERADMHWTFISGIERGRKDPRVSTLGRIATALGVTPADLLRSPRRAKAAKGAGR